MSKQPTQAADELAEIKAQLHALQEEQRRQAQAFEAERTALLADKRAAEARLADLAIPIPAGASDAEREELQRLRDQRLLLALSPTAANSFHAQKTAEFQAKQDRFHSGVCRELVAGDVLFACMAETSPDGAADGRVHSIAGTARIVGVSSPDADPTVLRDKAFSKFWRALGCSKPPEFYFLEPIADPATVREIRDTFTKACDAGASHNALIDLHLPYVAAEVAKWKQRNEVARPKSRTVEMPDRFSGAEQNGAMMPLPVLGW